MFLICLIFQYLWIHNIFGSSIFCVDKVIVWIANSGTSNQCVNISHTILKIVLVLCWLWLQMPIELQSLKLKWQICWNHRNLRLRTSSPLKGPVKFFASMMLVINFFTERRVLLQSLGWLIFRNMIKYLLNNKINGISIMKKKFRNNLLRIKRNLFTTGPTKYGLKFINERKLFKECLLLKLDKKRNIEKRKENI